MELTYREIENIYFDGGITKEGKELTLIEQGEWVQEHKYQTLEIIISDGEKYYATDIGRSGSEFSYYTYDSELYGNDEIADVVEVEKRKITIEKWVAK